jgi:hypothetical protein
MANIAQESLGMSSRPCRSFIARTLLVGLGAVALMLWPARPALADQAPFWESPVGLVPGDPTTQVRMASENVDVQVVEHDDEIRAEVTARFDMINDGPDQTLKVGFPASTVSLFDNLAQPDAEGRRHADAPVLFSPDSLRAFKVSVNGRELRSWRQDIPAAAQAGFGADWLMWEMTYPAGQPVLVDVSYEQVLTDRAGDQVAQPMYVLRTGALWAGSIGDAVVTFSAPDGGAFVGGPELFSRTEADGTTTTYPRAGQIYEPEAAADSTPTRMVWHLTDVEPTGDVGATYVRSAAWQRFTQADAAIVASPSPSADQLQEAASSAFAILTGVYPCSLPASQVCITGPYNIPRGLVDRLPGPARDRARQAAELAPDDGAHQLVLGNLEYWFAMPRRKHHGELQCWPTRGVDAYEKAITLGAPGAAGQLDDLHEAARQSRTYPGQKLFTCNGQGDTRLDIELINATVVQANTYWSSGVGRGGTAEFFPDYFAGDWLAQRQAEVADLRSAQQYREAHPVSIDIGQITLNDDGTATAETVEQWDDTTYAADGAVIRADSGTLQRRYRLQYLDDQWKIVGATIIRP